VSCPPVGGGHDSFAPANLWSVCYLLSGSCRMTVEKVEDDCVHCVWQHYDSKEIMRGDFDPITLSKSQA
jgi:hypothetical protein